MSHDDHTDHDTTPDIPNLPAPPPITRGHRRPRVPTTGRLPATPHDRAPQPAVGREPALRTGEGMYRGPR
jgi:hypothetical protein